MKTFYLLCMMGLCLPFAAQAMKANSSLDASDRHETFLEKNHNDWNGSEIFKAIHANEIQSLKTKINVYKDFPKKGILFQDFSPILWHSESFQICINLFYEFYNQRGIEAVVGLESRGFIIGAALAYKLGVSFIPVRKAGKIPGAVYTVDYEKEYGMDSFCIAMDALNPDQNVLIIDDLIATGGSAIAAIELVKLAGGNPVEFASILEIKELRGRQKLNIPSFNLID